MAFNNWRRRLANWIAPPVQQPRRLRVTHVWTGASSKTETDILALFTDDAVRLTRQDIDARLDVTTASQILPKMVGRGLLQVEMDTRPYRYQRTAYKTVELARAYSDSSPILTEDLT